MCEVTVLLQNWSKVRLSLPPPPPPPQPPSSKITKNGVNLLEEKRKAKRYTSRLERECRQRPTDVASGV